MRYSLSGVARDDIEEIAAIYANDNPNASTRFIAEVDRVLSLLLDHPFAGERIDEVHRHYPLHGFPFYLNYRVDNHANCIRVVAVSNQRRRPDYWRNRIEEAAAVYAVPLAA